MPVGADLSHPMWQQLKSTPGARSGRKDAPNLTIHDIAAQALPKLPSKAGKTLLDVNGQDFARRLKKIQQFAVSVVLALVVHTQQRVVATVEDSALRVEMGALELQEEDAPKRILWSKPLGFLGVIKPHRRNESWSAGLW